MKPNDSQSGKHCKRTNQFCKDSNTKTENNYVEDRETIDEKDRR